MHLMFFLFQQICLFSEKDDDDAIYRTGKERDAAIIDLILDCREKEQPILVGTVSIEKSESLSEALKRKKYRTMFLMQDFIKRRLKLSQMLGYRAVTIATNMAGRGTDIQLGEILK